MAHVFVAIHQHVLGPFVDRTKRVRLDSKIQSQTMYELFDILEKHGFITLEDADKIADLPEKQVEKLYIEVYLSVFGVQTSREALRTFRLNQKRAQEPNRFCALNFFALTTHHPLVSHPLLTIHYPLLTTHYFLIFFLFFHLTRHFHSNGVPQRNRS